jgi:threonine aldolase
MIGGQMRQAGIIAAAGIVALDTMIDRIADDHRNAKRLADGLAQIDGVSVDLNRVQTNMFRFAVADVATANVLSERLIEKGIKFGAGGNSFRVVLHWQIDSVDVDYILNNVRLVMNDIR